MIVRCPASPPVLGQRRRPHPGAACRNGIPGARYLARLQRAALNARVHVTRGVPKGPSHPLAKCIRWRVHFAGRHRGSAQDRGEAVWGSGQNGSRSRRPGFASQPCCLPAVGPRTSHAASLCLGFLTCKQGMLTVSTSRGSRKDQIEDFEECVPDSKFCPSGGSANVLWSN